MYSFKLTSEFVDETVCPCVSDVDVDERSQEESAVRFNSVCELSVLLNSLFTRIGWVCDADDGASIDEEAQE